MDLDLYGKAVLKWTLKERGVIQTVTGDLAQ